MKRNDPELDHIDPWVAGVIRQAVKICGFEKVRRLLDTLEREDRQKEASP